jgi:hypothetical protein
MRKFDLISYAVMQGRGCYVPFSFGTVRILCPKISWEKLALVVYTEKKILWCHEGIG